MDFRSLQNVYMQRCIDLAKLGFKGVKSNPMVGALIVHNDSVIGEGYHVSFGSPHAEINALFSVKEEQKHLIADSTLYVTLEPCSHMGKTPPCAHRIVKERIAHVVIGCVDPNPMVAGKGIQYLQDHGVKVSLSDMKQSCEKLISKFKANLSGLPYIQLKWAQSADNFMGSTHGSVWLSNPITAILTHEYRSQYDAVLVGKNTILLDNPQLTTRYAEGADPIRIVLDSQNQVPKSSHILSDNKPTIVLNRIKDEVQNAIHYIKVSDTHDIASVLKMLYAKGITSVIVEGGSKVLKSFIDSGIWHEAMVIQTKHILSDGIKAPFLEGKLEEKHTLKEDEILIITNPNIE